MITIKSKTTIRLFIIAFLIIFLCPAFADSKIVSENDFSGKVGIFGIAGNRTSAALTNQTADYIKKIFNDCGRFLPVENKQLDAALNHSKENNDKDIYLHAAKLLNLDIFVIVSSFQIGDIIYSDLRVVPLNESYGNLKKTVRLKSRNNLNIPLKTGREIAILHEKLPVIARVEKVYNDSLYLINAGEWHGLKNDKNYSIKGTEIKIVQTGRFESLVKIPFKKNEREKILIKIYPDTESIVKEIKDDISRNTIAKYSIADVSPKNTGKRLLESVCLVNIGTNILIPGYGAFLTTSYMGFENPQPDLYGITLSLSLVTMHFLLPEIMTNFNINFFPWKQDPDKTERMQDFQKFLWLSLPLTFSASYMHQLAYQFSRSEILPPFFHDRDNIAGLFSVIIPGGGLFYKGHKLAGWGFYFSEMVLAGYTVYNYDKDYGKYALYSLGAIKLIDIVFAYFAGSGYAFYDLEMEGEIKTPVTMGFRQGAGNENILNIMASAEF